MTVHSDRLAPHAPPALAATAIARRTPVEQDTALVWPLLVKGEVAGVVAFERQHGTFDDRDRAMAASVASQLAVQLENTRLYRTIDSLFRSYLAPSVVTRLLADPDQAALGGAVVEVTALFADLRGFTTYSEQHDPDKVVALLNRYYAAIVPRLLEHEGTVVNYAGDAVMAVFNAPTRQPDHAMPPRVPRSPFERPSTTSRADDPSSRPSASASTPARRWSGTSAPSSATTR